VAGRLVRVNLAAGAVTDEGLEEDLVRRFIGGKGLGAHILYGELPAGISPLDSRNLLVFAVGPLTGTLAPGGSRTVVCTKSPLTGLWLDSNCGGRFGSTLRTAGVDVLILEGAAPAPVYVLLTDQGVQVRSAEELWGLGTFETTSRLRELHGAGCSVACIGPAGERQARIASIIADGRAFGRGGAGAVMGSKKVKAVVVARGTGEPRPKDDRLFARAVKEALNEVGIHPDTGGARPRYGTNAILSLIKGAGAYPTCNFLGRDFPGLATLDEEVVRGYFTQNRACLGCPIACSKISRVNEGEYAGAWVEGPEYEDVWSLGAQCGHANVAATIRGEYLCDDCGLDAISAGVAVGFAMECFERGVLNEFEIGFPLPFGGWRAEIKLLEMMGRGEGIGALLSCGVREAARVIGRGSERFAMHVKGLELPAYDPRGAVGMGLAYATSDRGACHLRAWPVGEEILSTKGRYDPLSSEHKAELVKSQQDWFSVVDSCGLCLFSTFALSPDQVADLLYAFTGFEEHGNGDSLMRIGERIYNLTRLFNVREGVSRQEDTLPERLLKEPLAAGPAAGNLPDLEGMLSEYYLVRGWDAEGHPTVTKLRELGLMNHDH